ncbi:MAG TPA: hypothetical protein PLF40_24280 [Kofleriaceae bacterium]|nr:hypothetical protein [Kofleriaceae bacterium]
MRFFASTVASTVAAFAAMPAVAAHADSVGEVVDRPPELTHETVWDKAVLPHRHECEVALFKAEKVLQNREALGVGLLTNVQREHRARLLNEARGLVGYCLTKNPAHPTALLRMAAIERRSGNTATASALLDRFFAGEQIERNFPDVNDTPPADKQTLIATGLLAAALQTWQTDDRTTVLRQLRAALQVAAERDWRVTQLVTTALAECLQQDHQSDAAVRLLQPGPSGTQHALALAVALDRSEHEAELGELVRQWRDSGSLAVMRDLPGLAQMIDQLPHSEGNYYRALALELSGKRSAARAWWLAYIGDAGARWRQRARVHVARLDALARSAP